jgi:hypothetical protein
MQANQIPAKFNIPFANNAESPYVRSIPQASQIGIQDGAASLTDGFPPLTFLDAGAGGVSPFGEDANGILKQSTSWDRWFSAGAPVTWDSAFSAAIGGYPLGAVVQSLTTPGLWWYCQADNNTNNPDTGGGNWLGFNMVQTVPGNQGRFALSTGTACTLTPVNGGLMWINGLNYLIASAGVNFSNAGLSNNTLYYAYVRNVAGTLTGDFSTTGYVAASNGVPQKIGDAIRTLVGMVYTNGSGQFVSQDGTFTILTYFQRQLKRTRTQFSTDHTVTATAFAEINTEIRNTFLVWANENVDFYTAGSFSCGANQAAATQISFDGGSGEQESCAVANNSGIARAPLAISGTKIGLSEGLHYATLLGAVGSGTGTWNSANTNSTAQGTITIGLQG